MKYGNTHIRAFADTDTKARLEGVKALLRAREEFKDRVTFQVVAFPQDGVVRDPGAEDYVEQALKLGADVVGGIPWIEYTAAGEQEHIDRMFALAKKYNKDISMLIDDAGDATLHTLEKLAVKTIQEGWEGRVTAQHARAMALYPEVYYRKIEALLKRAQIGVVSDPHTARFTPGWPRSTRPGCALPWARMTSPMRIIPSGATTCWKWLFWRPI